MSFTGHKHVADAPAGHGVVFGKSVEDDGALAHPRKRGDAGRHGAVIGHVGIDFVGKHQQVVADGKLGDGVERSLIQHGAARVRGAADQDCLGARRDERLKRFRIKLEAVLFAQRIGNRLGLRDMWVGKIDQIAGIGDQNFVAGVQIGEHGQEDAVDHAGGHEYFFRRVLKAIPGAVSGQGLAEFHGPGNGPVMHFLIVQRLFAGVYDVGGRAEIRFAEFQMDDGAPLLLQLVGVGDDVSYAGQRSVFHPLGLANGAGGTGGHAMPRLVGKMCMGKLPVRSRTVLAHAFGGPRAGSRAWEGRAVKASLPRRTSNQSTSSLRTRAMFLYSRFGRMLLSKGMATNRSTACFSGM